MRARAFARRRCRGGTGWDGVGWGGMRGGCKLRRSRVAQSRAVPSRAEQSRAEQSRAEQGMCDLSPPRQPANGRRARPLLCSSPQRTHRLLRLVLSHTRVLFNGLSYLGRLIGHSRLVLFNALCRLLVFKERRVPVCRDDPDSHLVGFAW